MDPSILEHCVHVWVFFFFIESTYRYKVQYLFKVKTNVTLYEKVKRNVQQMCNNTILSTSIQIKSHM